MARRSGVAVGMKSIAARVLLVWLSRRDKGAMSEFQPLSVPTADAGGGTTGRGGACVAVPLEPNAPARVRVESVRTAAMDANKTIDPAGEGADIHDGEPGRGAVRPAELSWRAWWRILKRVWNEVSDDRVLLIAAGATYYLLLALFPALAAFVSIYGFVADPRTIAEHVAFLGARAGAPEHVVAVALEPLLRLRGVGEALRVGEGRERRDGLAGLRVLALCGARCAVAARAAPLGAVARIEELLAARGGGAGERRSLAPRRAFVAGEELRGLHGLCRACGCHGRRDENASHVHVSPW